MDREKLKNFFCSGERLPLKDILPDVEIVKKSSFPFGDILDCFPSIAIILNRQRQIIYSNPSLSKWCLAYGQSKPLPGSRLGDVFGCVNSSISPDGCGAAENCSVCGAGLAITENLNTDRPVNNECRIIIEQENQKEYLDLSVTAIPIKIQNEQYTLLFIDDISNEKRRNALEQIFFHDILNTSGAIMAISELLLQTENQQQLDSLLKNNRSAALQLVEEIEEQHDLLKAENNELTIEMDSVSSLNLLSEVVGRCSSNSAFFDITVEIDPNSEDIHFSSNSTLLRRVLGNMLKNALEATQPGKTVRLGCLRKEEYLEFWVNNQEIMPREIQLQIFQRSFSTKNKSRGLGTYSMKLLTERYLKGNISFTVSEQEGTTFFANIPL